MATKEKRVLTYNVHAIGPHFGQHGEQIASRVKFDGKDALAAHLSSLTENKYYNIYKIENGIDQTLERLRLFGAGELVPSSVD